MINNPDLVIKLATQLKEERAAKVLAEIKIKELAPKAKVYDNIAECQEFTYSTNLEIRASCWLRDYKRKLVYVW